VAALLAPVDVFVFVYDGVELSLGTQGHQAEAVAVRFEGGQGDCVEPGAAGGRLEPRFVEGAPADVELLTGDVELSDGLVTRDDGGDGLANPAVGLHGPPVHGSVVAQDA